jgi:hypothetical protein
MKFKVGDIVKDKDGDDIRIVCVDKKGSLPIVGVFDDVVYEYSKEGFGDCAADLVAPAKPKVKFLAQQYFDGSLVWTKEGSDAAMSRSSLLRIPSLDLECEVDE